MIVAFSAFLLLTSTPNASAASITVNSTADPGDGVCNGAQCTLREAIAAANADVLADGVTFNIPANSDPGCVPATGVCTITPVSALPAITQPAAINGYSQPGAGLNTMSMGNNAVLKIEIDGTNAGTTDGLRITGSGVNIQGLVINDFVGYAVSIVGPGATLNTVTGNFIGTDVTGTVGKGNHGGISITGGAVDNTIGAAINGSRNVIAGSFFDEGILLEGPNTIRNNYIGTDKTGTAAMFNTYGVVIRGSGGATIGGAGANEGNVISGNYFEGITVCCDGGTVIQGNKIGVGADGTTPLGNGSQGIFLDSPAQDVTIGGTAPGAGNIIAYNTTVGIYHTGGLGVSIRGNSIHDHFGGAIDLDGDGPTANDNGDVDSGANNRQNFPVLTHVATSPGIVSVIGSLNSTPNTLFTLDFYSGGCDGMPEAKAWLGSVDIPVGASGDASFDTDISSDLPPGQFVIATATDPGNNTSELGWCVGVLTQGDVDCSGSVNSVDALKTLRHSAGLPVTQNEPCTDIATPGVMTWGDVDCSGGVNAVDALKLLRHSAGLPVQQTEPPPCPDIGTQM